MWDHDGLVGKAQTYFERSEAVPADDDAFALWLLLGLEFLLRAPLAAVHPALLADPNGDAIMHAVGFPGAPDSKEPKSIQIATVISRLGRIVANFTREREDDASILTALRNRELHSSEAAIASVDVTFYLPRFTRVVEVICEHLGLDASDLVGEEVIQQGRRLVDAEDKKLAHEVKTRIESAKDFVKNLSDTEIASRYSEATESFQHGAVVVPCPACRMNVELLLDPIRSTDERLDDGQIVRDVISIVRGLSCAVCALALGSTAAVKAAGLPQQYTTTERESMTDRYLSEYEPDDYGND